MKKECEYYLYTMLNGKKINCKVTKKEWIIAERDAGFHPKIASDHPEYMNTFATGGFRSGDSGGRMVWLGAKPIIEDGLEDEGDYDISDYLNKDHSMGLKQDLHNYIKTQEWKVEQYKNVADTLLSTIMEIQESVETIFPSLTSIIDAAKRFRDDTFEEIENANRD